MTTAGSYPGRIGTTLLFKLLCVLASTLVTQSSCVYTCQASDGLKSSPGTVRQIDFWTNVPEHWDSWENVSLGRLHMDWKLDPESKRIIVTYRGIGSLGMPTRITLSLESFDGTHIVFRAKSGGYRGVYEGDFNGKSINGTVAWYSAFGGRKHKWRAEWTGAENWPARTTIADAEAAGAGAAGSTQQLCGQVQIATGSARSQTSARVRQSPPRVHKTDEESQLKITYPEHYPFPLVAIRFPSDYSDSFIDEIAGFKHFQKEKKEILTELVNEQVIKSTYFACELYEYLKARLPGKTIVLIPCKLKTDGSGKVIDFPVSKPIPSVVQLDIFSWINMGRLKRPGAHLSQPDTFADKARTWLSISMPIERKRQLFAGQPVVVPESTELRQSIESFYNVNHDGGKWKEFSAAGKSVPTIHNQSADKQFTVVHQDFRYPRQALALEANGSADDIEPAAKEQLRYYGNLVIDALNGQDLETIEPILLAEYVDDIAPDLSQSLGATETKPTPSLAKQQRYFHHCLAAMREQLLSVEADSVAQTIYAGDFGKQFRTAINAEMEYKKKTMAAQQRQAAAALLCGAALGGAVGAAATGAAAAGFFTAVAAASASIMSHEQKLKNQLRNDFLKVWNDSRKAQVSCLLTLDNDTIEVRGDGAEMFRKNMKEAYEKRFGMTASTSGAM